MAINLTDIRKLKKDNPQAGLVWTARWSHGWYSGTDYDEFPSHYTPETIARHIRNTRFDRQGTGAVILSEELSTMEIDKSRK